MARQRSSKIEKEQEQKREARRRQVSKEQWQRWKRNAAKPDYAIPAIQILNSVGKVTRLQYLESMLGMEERFPGRGWREAADELHKFYHDRGFGLNELRRVDGELLSVGII